MIISEIVKIASQVQHGIDLNAFDWSQGTQVCTSELQPVYKLEEQGVVIFFIPGERSPQAAIVGVWANIGGTSKAFAIKRMFTDQHLRNQGLMTALYHALILKLRLTLASDQALAPFSVKIWQTLAQRHQVKILNVSTRETSERITPQDIVDELNLARDNTYLVCSESMNYLQELERPLIEACVLLDNVIYTHADNLGLYP